MSDVKKDIAKAEKDVWETALDYWPEALTVATALGGRAAGRRHARKYIDDAMRGKVKPVAEDVAAFKTQKGREKFVRDSGRGAAIGLGVFPAGLVGGKYLGKEYSEGRKKNRK